MIKIIMVSAYTIAIVAVALIIYAIVVVFIDALSLPTVATSYTTGQCVWLEELGTKGRLERRTCPLIMPPRYEHVYVK